MAANTETEIARALPAPRGSTGLIAWARGNLFSEWYNSLLTIVSIVIIGLVLWFGLRWVIAAADWSVISVLGGPAGHRPVQHGGGLRRPELLLATPDRSAADHFHGGHGMGSHRWSHHQAYRHWRGGGPSPVRFPPLQPRYHGAGHTSAASRQLAEPVPRLGDRSLCALGNAYPVGPSGHRGILCVACSAAGSA